MTRPTRVAPLAALLLAALAVAPASASSDVRTPLRLGEFHVAPDGLDRIRDRWVDGLLRTHEAGTWAPARLELSDADLKDMGLPPRRALLGKRFPVPTAVYPDGKMVPLAGGKGGEKSGGPKGGGGNGSGGSGGSGGGSAQPAVAAYGGAGFLGIRPGALLLTVTNNSIGWCSMAHVFGSPGSYSISTAGHCGKNGDVGTVIGVVGNRPGVPVLMDFGKYTRSTGDGGIGNDWALIGVDAPYQPLVTPTMAGWGGPFGVFTKTGEVVAPNGSITADPFLAQQILHYGHGTGVGFPVGTPRSGTAITWRPKYFTFFGAITPGDSGSGSNTLTGDTVGAQREAAGINTHIYVDSSLKTGVGLMAATRTTLVGTPANGQLIPYPAPTPVPLP